MGASSTSAEASVPPSGPQLDATDVAMQRLTIERVGLTPLAYVVFSVGLCELTPLGTASALARPLTLAITLVVLIRLFVTERARRSPTISTAQRFVLRVFTLASILCFSSLCGQSLWVAGVAPASMTSLIILGGVASGGIMTLASDRLLTRLFIVGALLPPIVMSFAEGVPRGVTLALILCFVFYAQVGNRLYQQTLESLQRHQQLEAQSKSLTRAKQEAEQASQAKGTFLATMSHELRTPLNAVVGMADLLLDDELSMRQRDMVATLRGSADALLHIINDILDFSKIEAGKLALETVAFDPARIVRDVEALLRHGPRETGVMLQCHTEGLPSAVVGDPGRLRQMLLNLGSNALKFTHRGAVVIGARGVVSAQGSRDDTASIYFYVKDTGIGISPAKLGTIFDRFEQADSRTARKYGGTGLGLAITQQLARLMGGKVSVNSELDVGSTFWFELTFPVATVGVQVASSAPPSGRDNPGLRILVVDDNEVNLKVAVQMLSRLGHDSTVARNGREACELAMNGSYDIVLMDCMMPEMDGLEATRKLRSEGYEGVIVAMTANARPEDRDACLLAGMNEHLAKPVRLDSIRSTLDKIAVHS
jgi:signal transduction histidine kinase